jgi:hypothetical protein
MKKSWPVLGVALTLLVSLGAGCAEDDLFIGGGGKKPPTSNESPNDNPTPQPSGSGLVGGIR